jgi:prepilin-type processing-associated H-X9-DG protein
VPQADAAEVAASLCADDDTQRQWVRRIFERTGVTQRGAVLARDAGAEGVSLEEVRRFYRPRQGPDDRGPRTEARMELFARHAPPLAAEAAGEALRDAGAVPGDISHLVTVSCTGFFAPGLDVALIRQLGLSASVQRLQVGFMGCHAAFNALAAAADIIRSRPQARVLVVCAELCSLHFAYGWHPQRVVANALFADGAAAAVVGQAPGRTQIIAASSLLLPASEDAMTWRIGDYGFEMTLSPELPALIQQHLGSWLQTWTRAGETLHWAIHPGGPKVLEAVCDAAGAPREAAAVSRSVLAEHGNMSSATILVILKRLAEQRVRGRCVALGFGPGLMAEGLLLQLR